MSTTSLAALYSAYPKSTRWKDPLGPLSVVDLYEIKAQIPTFNPFTDGGPSTADDVYISFPDGGWIIWSPRRYRLPSKYRPGEFRDTVYYIPILSPERQAEWDKYLRGEAPRPKWSFLSGIYDVLTMAGGKPQPPKYNPEDFPDGYGLMPVMIGREPLSEYEKYYEYVWRVNPRQTSSQTSRPTTTQPSNTQPASTQPTTTQPSNTQPASTQPTTTQPSNTQPASTQPTTTQPSNTQPATTQPANTRPPANQTQNSPRPTFNFSFAPITNLRQMGPATRQVFGQSIGGALGEMWDRVAAGANSSAMPSYAAAQTPLLSSLFGMPRRQAVSRNAAQFAKAWNSGLGAYNNALGDLYNALYYATATDASESASDTISGSDMRRRIIGILADWFSNSMNWIR